MLNDAAGHKEPSIKTENVLSEQERAALERCHKRRPSSDRLVSYALKNKAFNVPASLRTLAALVSPRLSISPSDDHENAFFGEKSHSPHHDKTVLANIYHQSRQVYFDNSVELCPTQEARLKTQKAAAGFYRYAQSICEQEGLAFSLCGQNKCIGFLAVGPKLVLVAISEDRVPSRDRGIRAEMARLIDKINAIDENPYQFGLAALPTKEQYLIMRGLSTPKIYAGDRTDIADELLHNQFHACEYDKCGDDGTHNSWSETRTADSSEDNNAFESVLPYSETDMFSCQSHNLVAGIPVPLLKYRTRCVEVALMVALNKVGRFIEFNPQDVSMEAFSCGLWTNAVAQEHIDNIKTDYQNGYFLSAIEGFSASKRNAKYTIEASIEVPLTNGRTAYLDYWGPCNLHCQQLLDNMRAVCAVGGKESSFLGPIFESDTKAAFPVRFLPKTRAKEDAQLLEEINSKAAASKRFKP